MSFFRRTRHWSDREDDRYQRREGHRRRNASISSHRAKQRARKQTFASSAHHGQRSGFGDWFVYWVLLGCLWDNDD